MILFHLRPWMTWVLFTSCLPLNMNFYICEMMPGPRQHAFEPSLPQPLTRPLRFLRRRLHSCVVAQGIEPQVLSDDLLGKSGQVEVRVGASVASSWESHLGYLCYSPARSHLSNLVRFCQVVVRKPAEEVETAVMVPAAVGLTLIILMPLNWSGMRCPVFCRKTGV